MIDDTGRKIFAQLDATLPGERINALEHLIAHFAKQNPPMTFRQLAADLAGAVPAHKFAELDAKLQATTASLPAIPAGERPGRRRARDAAI